MQFLRSGKVVTEAAPPHCLLLCKKLLGVSIHPLGGNPPKHKDKKLHLLLPRLWVELETLFVTTLSQHIHQGQAHSEKELEEGAG